MFSSASALSKNNFGAPPQDYRRPTLVFERLLGKGPFFAYLPTLDDVIASRGVNPIMVGGKIIGAVGASGGAGSQDDVVSQAGVAAMK